MIIRFEAEGAQAVDTHETKRLWIFIGDDWWKLSEGKDGTLSIEAENNPDISLVARSSGQLLLWQGEFA